MSRGVECRSTRRRSTRCRSTRRHSTCHGHWLRLRPRRPGVPRPRQRLDFFSSTWPSPQVLIKFSQQTDHGREIRAFIFLHQKLKAKFRNRGPRFRFATELNSPISPRISNALVFLRDTLETGSTAAIPKHSFVLRPRRAQLSAHGPAAEAQT